MKQKDTMTPAQKQAITHREGPMLVLAGPGSGKTFVITRRVQYLTAEAGVDPSRVLVITFTNAAAEEMRQRFLALAPQAGNQVTFGTFHSVFFRILKYAYGYQGNQILREQMRHEIYQDILRELAYEVQDQREFYQAVTSEIGKVKELLIYGQQSKGKEGLLDLSGYHSTSCPSQIFQVFYERYQNRLLTERLIDFDDMGTMCYELLCQRPDILAIWQEKYQYILVDEMQDTNRLQFDIVRMLAKPQNNLMLVGDDDQSIYQFRGARPEIMLDFSKQFPKGKQVLLDCNFRSVPGIVEGAKRVISGNAKRYPKDIQAVREAGEITPIRLEVLETTKEQNRFVIEEIQRLYTGGVPYEEMAVLFRTNVQPQLLAAAMLSANIPFQLRDTMPNIYDHWIAKNLFAYIHLANQYKVCDGVLERGSFLQVMNRPKRYLSRELLANETLTFDGLRDLCADKPYIWEKLQKMEYDLWMLGGKRGIPMAPYAAVHYIRHIIGYEDYLKEYAEFRGIHADDMLAVLDELEEAARPFATIPDWFEHIEAFRSSLEEKRRENRNIGKRTGVNLMTYHGAKGLEFDTVFLIDLVEGLTPYRRAEAPQEMEEERRMFYVAMTRAKNRLYLLRVKERMGREQVPSRFLRELLDMSLPLKTGMRVFHKKLGYARIEAVKKDKVVIHTEKPAKTLTLNLHHCMENQLLEIVGNT